MPDWMHSLFYVIIFSVTLTFIFLLTKDFLGLIAGLIAGHLVASFLVSHIPGFWGRKK
jgi:hypothetical protein